MNAKFKLRRLNAMLAVFEYGSTLKASERIHMSQPTVAALVAACEADVGISLFERTSRGMRPTAEGKPFVARCSAAVDHLRQAEAMIRQRHGSATSPFHRNVSEVQLRALMAIVETGGFSQAGRSMGITQPSIYRAARELETLCAIRLWQRNGPNIDPTSDARELSRLAGLCFSEILAGFEEVAEAQGKIQGQLRIGALPLARSDWLPRALAATLNRHPHAGVQVTDGPYEEQLNALRHARIDMILGALRDPAPAPDIEQECLFEDPQLILVRADHPLAQHFDSDTDKLTPSQLGSLSWILPRQGTPGRKAFDRFLATKGLPSATNVVECSSIVTTRSLLLLTDYAAILSRQQVVSDIETGHFKIMGPPLTGSLRPIGLATRKGARFTKLQQAFLGHVRKIAVEATA